MRITLYQYQHRQYIFLHRVYNIFSKTERRFILKFNITGERGIGVGDGGIDERDGGVAGDGGVGGDGGDGGDGGVGGENRANNESSIYLDDIKEPHFQILIWNGHLFRDLNARFTTVSFKPLCF